MHDNPGVDFFNATVKATGDNYIFQESVDGKDAFTSEAKKMQTAPTPVLTIT